MGFDLTNGCIGCNSQVEKEEHDDEDGDEETWHSICLGCFQNIYQGKVSHRVIGQVKLSDDEVFCVHCCEGTSMSFEILLCKNHIPKCFGETIDFCVENADIEDPDWKCTMCGTILSGDDDPTPTTICDNKECEWRGNFVQIEHTDLCGSETCIRC